MTDRLPSTKVLGAMLALAFAASLAIAPDLAPIGPTVLHEDSGALLFQRDIESSDDAPVAPLWAAFLSPFPIALRQVAASSPCAAADAASDRLNGHARLIALRL